MEKQADISAAKLQGRIGQRLTVLVDEIDEDGCVARSPADAPEIDGLVYIEDASEVSPGDWLEVTITGADAHDLYAARPA